MHAAEQAKQSECCVAAPVHKLGTNLVDMCRGRHAAMSGSMLQPRPSLPASPSVRQSQEYHTKSWSCVVMLAKIASD